MNLTALSLEQLETMHGALGEYLGARRRHEAARRLEALEAQRRQVALELDEARAQLAAQKEMSGRLMAALKLTAPSTNGHAKPAGAVEADTPPEQPSVSEPAWGDEMDAPVVSKPAGRKRKSAPGNADKLFAGDEPVPAADLPAESLDGTLTLADLAALEDEW